MKTELVSEQFMGVLALAAQTCMCVCVCVCEGGDCMVGLGIENSTINPRWIQHIQYFLVLAP